MSYTNLYLLIISAIAGYYSTAIANFIVKYIWTSDFKNKDIEIKKNFSNMRYLK
jgi:hypothetical protein